MSLKNKYILNEDLKQLKERILWSYWGCSEIFILFECIRGHTFIIFGGKLSENGLKWQITTLVNITEVKKTQKLAVEVFSILQTV